MVAMNSGYVYDNKHEVLRLRVGRRSLVVGCQPRPPDLFAPVVRGSVPEAGRTDGDTCLSQHRRERELYPLAAGVHRVLDERSHPFGGADRTREPPEDGGVGSRLLQVRQVVLNGEWFQSDVVARGVTGCRSIVMRSGTDEGFR